jgi:hypothetical protein
VELDDSIMSRRRLNLMALATCGLCVLLADCAGTISSKEDLLAAAGFQWKLADAPDWRVSLNSLPPHKIARRTVKRPGNLLLC